MQTGRRGEDLRMFFSWYGGDFTTDPDFADKTPEQRANPGMASWSNDGYLEQQRRRLLGMSKVVSEDALRRALAKIDETAGVQWVQAHLDYRVRPLLAEPWVLDVDATIKPLYGHQEGAVVGYNPRKPGRPSHCYHTYMLSDLRLVLRVA